MAEFYSRNVLPKTIPQPKCAKIVPTYGKKVMDDGTIKVVETGKTNIYEKIQASKDETLVYNILDRFKAGDVSVLNQRQGTYGDFTEMPKTLAEAQQTLIDAENYFYSLPLDVRKEFNHSVSEFLHCAGDGKLAEKHAYFKAPEPVDKAIKQVAQQQALEQTVNQTVIPTPNITTQGGTNE